MDPRVKASLVFVGAALIMAGLSLIATAALSVPSDSYAIGYGWWGFPILLAGVTVLVVERATREVVKVRCRNCGSLVNAGVDNCLACWAPMREGT